MEAGLPPAPDFEERKHISRTATPDETLISLKTTHHVSCAIGPTQTTGQADINYLITCKARTFTADLSTTSDGVTPCGKMDVESMKAMLKMEPGKNLDKAYSAANTDYFDYTAVCDFCGYTLACYTGGYDILPMFQNMQPCASMNLNEHMYQIEPRSLLVPRALVPSVAHENVLARILRKCGVSRMYTTIDGHPHGPQFLDADGIADYCLRLYGMILTHADTLRCAPPHALAFSRGMGKIMSMHGHTDEGGWVRDLWKFSKYSNVYGCITIDPSDTVKVVPWSLTKKNRIGAVMRHSLAAYLTFVRAASNMTGSLEGVVSIPYVKRQEGIEEKKFTDYKNLPDLTRDYIHLTKNALAEALSLNGWMGDLMAGFPYWSNPTRDDRHFGNNTILPFFWVEPTGLNFSTKFEYGDQLIIAANDRVVELPFAKGDFYRLTGYTEVKVKGAGGIDKARASGPMHYQQDMSTWRESGFSYLLSPRYNASDGLGMMRMMRHDERAHMSRPSFAGPGTTIGTMRWNTVDNPLPNPIEGIAAEKVNYICDFYTRAPLPTFSEMASARVQSTITMLTFGVTREARFNTSLVHKTIPKYLERRLSALNMYADETAFTKYEYLDEVPNYSNVPGDVLVRPPPVVPGAFEPGEEVSSGPDITGADGYLSMGGSATPQLRPTIAPHPRPGTKDYKDLPDNYGLAGTGGPRSATTATPGGIVPGVPGADGGTPPLASIARPDQGPSPDGDVALPTVYTADADSPESPPTPAGSNPMDAPVPPPGAGAQPQTPVPQPTVAERLMALVTPKPGAAVAPAPPTPLSGDEQKEVEIEARRRALLDAERERVAAKEQAAVRAAEQAVTQTRDAYEATKTQADLSKIKVDTSDQKCSIKAFRFTSLHDAVVEPVEMADVANNVGDLELMPSTEWGDHKHVALQEGAPLGIHMAKYHTVKPAEISADSPEVVAMYDAIEPALMHARNLRFKGMVKDVRMPPVLVTADEISVSTDKSPFNRAEQNSLVAYGGEKFLCATLGAWDVIRSRTKAKNPKSAAVRTVLNRDVNALPARVRHSLDKVPAFKMVQAMAL